MLYSLWTEPLVKGFHVGFRRTIIGISWMVLRCTICLFPCVHHSPSSGVKVERPGRGRRIPELATVLKSARLSMSFLVFLNRSLQYGILRRAGDRRRVPKPAAVWKETTSAVSPDNLSLPTPWWGWWWEVHLSWTGAFVFGLRFWTNSGERD